MESDACPSQTPDSRLKSLNRSVAPARSAAQVRNASAPSPFQDTRCGRTPSSLAIFSISPAADFNRSAAPDTTPASAWSSHASICS
ncbi:hypothetical protein ACVNF4_05995 [Streptomyces sp. S6]